MGKRIEYQKGQKVGECIYLEDAQPCVLPNGKFKRRALFMCTKCSSTFIAHIADVKMRKTVSCGCFKVNLMKDKLTKHGLRYNPMYNTYNSMKSRCLNPKNKKYKYYGGRGITICNKWLNDISSFLDYVIKLPNYNKDGYTLDRINNNGNYEPGNLRWVDRHMQSVNTRRPKNKLGFTGVYSNGSGYSSAITVRRKKVHIGTYKTIKGAVNARNQYIINNGIREYLLQ